MDHRISGLPSCIIHQETLPFNSIRDLLFIEIKVLWNFVQRTERTLGLPPHLNWSAVLRLPQSNCAFLPKVIGERYFGKARHHPAPHLCAIYSLALGCYSSLPLSSQASICFPRDFSPLFCLFLISNLSLVEQFQGELVLISYQECNPKYD